jgi:hypothetical protein
MKEIELNLGEERKAAHGRRIGGSYGEEKY